MKTESSLEQKAWKALVERGVNRVPIVHRDGETGGGNGYLTSAKQLVKNPKHLSLISFDDDSEVIACSL